MALLDYTPITLNQYQVFINKQFVRTPCIDYLKVTSY